MLFARLVFLSAIVLSISIASASTPIQNSFFSSNAVLNDRLDVLPNGPYAVGHRSLCFFDPTGVSANLTYSIFGIPLPCPPTVNNVGRGTGFDDFYPVLPQSINRFSQLTNMWSIAAATWENFNMTMPYENVLPANDQSHPFIMMPLGGLDFSIEYMRWAYKLATYGVYMRLVQYHGGDVPWLQTYPASGEMILTWRVFDANLGISKILSDNSNHASPFYGVINTQQIGCMGHSLGGATCLTLAVGQSEFGLHSNPLVQFLILLDPTSALHPYASDLAKLNIPVLGLYAQADLSEQGIIRIHNANQNPINYALFTKNSVHQMNQVNDCALSLLSIQTGDVANSFFWDFPNQMYAAYCAPASDSPGNSASYVALQGFFNVQSFWMINFIEAFVDVGNVFNLNCAALQLQFRVSIVEVLQATHLLKPFVFYGPQKCGNMTWTAVTTPLGLQRGEDFYLPFSSSISYSDSYIENPLVHTDCSSVCPFWGYSSTFSNGNPSITLVQPSLATLESNRACLCPAPFGC